MPNDHQPYDESSLVVLAGRVDVSTVAGLRERLHHAVDARLDDLVLDLSGVDIIDATGLAMLAGTSRRATAAGRTLLLRGVPPRIVRLLHATRLDRVLHLEQRVPATVS